MSDILIIPDVHGRSFWREPVTSEEFDHIVFLGDYLDPYPQEGITQRQAFENFKEIVELKQSAPKQVTLLLGNHDMHYYSQHYCRLAPKVRYNSSHAWKYKQFFTEHRSLFSLAYEINANDRRYLFTHAGITKEWYDLHHTLIGDCTAHNLQSLLRAPNGYEVLAEMGAERGGHDKWGSMIWADVAEMELTEPLPGIYQIFGHTLDSDPIITNDWVCLDCAQAFVLDTDAGTLTAWKKLEDMTPEQLYGVIEQEIERIYNDEAKL